MMRFFKSKFFIGFISGIGIILTYYFIIMPKLGPKLMEANLKVPHLPEIFVKEELPDINFDLELKSIEKGDKWRQS